MTSPACSPSRISAVRAGNVCSRAADSKAVRSVCLERSRSSPRRHHGPPAHGSGSFRNLIQGGARRAAYLARTANPGRSPGYPQIPLCSFLCPFQSRGTAREICCRASLIWLRTVLMLIPSCVAIPSYPECCAQDHDFPPRPGQLADRYPYQPKIFSDVHVLVRRPLAAVLLYCVTGGLFPFPVRITQNLQCFVGNNSRSGRRVVVAPSAGRPCAATPSLACGSYFAWRPRCQRGFPVSRKRFWSCRCKPHGTAIRHRRTGLAVTT